MNLRKNRHFDRSFFLSFDPWLAKVISHRRPPLCCVAPALLSLVAPALLLLVVTLMLILELILEVKAHPIDTTMMVAGRSLMSLTVFAAFSEQPFCKGLPPIWLALLLPRHLAFDILNPRLEHPVVLDGHYGFCCLLLVECP
jgi:hypothetical protein